MKTGLDMVLDVYKLVDVDAVKSMLTPGQVWKLQRPKNSKLKDIVVGSLALSNTQMQEGLVNVNIHASNKENVFINGNADNTMPDIETLTSITKIVLPLLDGYRGYDFSLVANAAPVPYQDDDGNWYINIRVSYFSFINHYKNI